MPRVIGIDLGTTNCCVAVAEGEKPKVIPNKHGYGTTPSVIAVTAEGARVVGQIAVRQAITNPENTVHAAKRLIGRPWGAEEVEHARAHAPFPIVEGPHGDVRIVLGGEEHSVPALSAMLLTEMRVVAEDYLGERVDRAVVTVPAYFNDAQRQAVRDAGRIAGLDVLRILNEPTAAALAYGFGRREPRTLAVYDLGGGTFDISIVRIDDVGEFHVEATTGDSYLGGEDFDDRITQLLLRAFLRDQGVDLSESAIALARIRQAAQKAKVDLSSIDRVEVSLPFIHTAESGPLNLQYELTREQLEQLTADLVTRTLQICEIGLAHAGLRPEEVDEVILVGGQTRMPAIQRAVAAYFEREPCKGVHPDEVVALGAAIAAESLAKGSELGLHDVTAHSLGIMTAGGLFDPLIPANTPVPVRTKSVFGTSRDGQRTVKIVVLQGESARADENEVLGRFALDGLRKAPAGAIEIEVAFEIDEDGIFSVSATDLETGEERSIDVLASSGLSEEEIRLMMEDGAQYLALRRAEEAAEHNRQACAVLLESLRRILPDAERRMAWTPVGADAVQKAQLAVEHVAASLEDADAAMLEKHRALLERAQGIIERALASDDA